MKFEIEITRRNVTPSQFLAYVRARVDAKGGVNFRSDLSLDYFAAGADLNFDVNHEALNDDSYRAGCKYEKSISKPYEMQTFVRYSNGTYYNEICEFEFDDEKTGHGYYYLINVDETPTEPETAEPETEKPESVTAPAEPFPHLTAEIHAEYETRRHNMTHYVQFGFMPSWAEENRTNPDRGLEQYSTPAKWNAYKAGTLSREKAVEIATRRALKEVDASEQKQIEKMEAAANAPRLEWLQISVEWVRNSYWSDNPHATAYAENMTTYGRASGCGYDKRSAAVGEALNLNSAVCRVLYEAAEKALSEGKHPARYSNGNCTWRDILGYGSGYSILPYFEGGVGVECFWHILEKCGYKCRIDESSRRFDHYTVSRKEVQ